LKKVKFSFPRTLQKTIDLCRSHVVEIGIGDIKHHENIFLPQPPMLVLSLEKIEEVPILCPEHNEEVLVQSPEHNKKMPVQYPKHIEDGLGISTDNLGNDSITTDVIEVANTLKELEGHEDEGNCQVAMDNEMYETIDDFSFPEEGIFYRIPSKQLTIEYNGFVKFVSRSFSLHLYGPSYNFDGRFMFSLYDKMVHFKEQLDRSAENLKETCQIKDNNIIECLKQIARWQNTVVDNQEKVKIIITNKDAWIEELSIKVK